MTVADLENSSEVNSNKCPCQFFVRIENIPWSATPRDVKDFFNGLDITPGGISILGRNAFVSFERWEDMSSALRRDGSVFYGEKLFLSVVDLKKVRKINDLHIQRSLHFLSLIASSRKGVSSTTGALDVHKKIRPTAVTAGTTGDHTVTNAAFVPEEIDSQTKGLAVVCLAPVSKPDVYCRRRIKPTPLRKVYHGTIYSNPFQNAEYWKRLIYG